MEEFGSAASEETARIEQFQSDVYKRIQEEVSKRRAEGKYPPSFEARLRTTFEALVPKGGGSTKEDVAHLLYEVDRNAFMDIDVPLASNKPGIAQVKKSLRTLMAWYLNYLVQQITNFTANLMQLLHLFEKRLTSVEARVAYLNPVVQVVPVVISEPDLKEVLKILQPHQTGRTLVTSAATNSLLSHLGLANFDAYGIDSDASSLDALSQVPLDVRWDDLFEHLVHLGKDTLSSAVLQGQFELHSLGDKEAMLHNVHEALLPGGTCIIIGHSPKVIATRTDLAVAQDLSPGSYFHPETWKVLAERAGFIEVRIDTLPDHTDEDQLYLIVGTRGSEQTSKES